MIRKGLWMNLKDYFEGESCRLLQLKQRYFLLKEFNSQLEKIVPNDHSFPIANLSSWELIRSCEDALVIDLASWAKGMRERFFNPIKEHCADFKRYKYLTKDYKEPTVRYLNYTPTKEQLEEHRKSFKKSHFKRMKEGQREVIEELFEGLLEKPNPKVNHEEIDKLAAKFDEITFRVRDDRDQFRAHRYDGNNLPENFKKISLEEIGQTFEGCEEILNGIRLMTEATSLGFIELFNPGSAVTDLLNSILYGSHERLIAMMGPHDFGLKYNRKEEISAAFRQFISEHNKKGGEFKKLFWHDCEETKEKSKEKST
jgi:hypothetical protein